MPPFAVTQAGDITGLNSTTLGAPGDITADLNSQGNEPNIAYGNGHATLDSNVLWPGLQGDLLDSTYLNVGNDSELAATWWQNWCDLSGKLGNAEAENAEVFGLTTSQ
jgi:hypothetical protein